MLSYPIEEAEQLLDSKLKAATQSLQNCEEDLDFLREQITVCLQLLGTETGGGLSGKGVRVGGGVAIAGAGADSGIGVGGGCSGLVTYLRHLLTFMMCQQTMEVAVARVYNWDVVQKRKEKEEEEKTKGKKSETAEDG